MAAVDARAALARLVEAAESGVLDEVCARLGVRVLGAFGSAARPHGDVDDLDIAAGFVVGSHELELLDALVELTDFDRIDLLDVDRADPVARAEAFVGVPLHEHVAGAYATEQLAALAERRDTEHLRALDRRALAG